MKLNKDVQWFALHFLLFFLLTACNSGSNDTKAIEAEVDIIVSANNSENNTDDEIGSPTSESLSKEIDDNTITIPLTQTLAEYQTENPQAIPLSCDTDNSRDLSLAIDSLNDFSQQIFSLTTTSSINSYANFIALSQLALTSREHTAALIEQLGLVQVTQNNDWFDIFCQLEQQMPTITTQVSMANNWQVNKSLLTHLNQYFPVTFVERQIDPTSDLWRLSITNDWLAEMQLAVIGQDYIHYQATDSTEAEIAKAIIVSGDITTASNEIGEYIRIIDDSSNIAINIIMPTFEQYSAVKANLVDTLNSFKQLEENKLEQILIPYFANNITSDDFVNAANWISHNNIDDIFADEGQNFTGINSIESFKLLLTSDTNNFTFDDSGKVKAQSSTQFSYEALTYQAAAFNPINSSVTIISSNIEFNICNEELFAEALWRPYFVVIEDANNNLIYTMTESRTPVIENQSNLCPEDIVLIEVTND